MAATWIQTAWRNDGNAYINISPTAGNALLFQSVTSAGGGSPTITALSAMSSTNGGGSILASFTIPAALATASSAGYHVTGAYLLNLPAGVASVLATYNGGAPGTTIIGAAEVNGVGSFIVGAQQGQAAPGTSADAISSGTADVTSLPAYLFGFCTDMNDNTNQVAGTGFTLRGTFGGYEAAVEDQSLASPTGNYAATFTDATHGGADTYVTTIFAMGLAVVGVPIAWLT